MFSKFKNYIARPGHLFKSSSYFMRKIYYYISIILHPRTYISRKIIKKKTSDLDSLGFAKIENFYDLNFNLSILDELKRKTNLNQKKSIYTLMKDEDFDTNSEVFKFITSDRIVDTVSNYLGFVPILTTVSLWYCPNTENFEESSQFFHLDHEDVSQVKCFYFIEDVDIEMGPTKFINTRKSKKIIEETNYKITKESKRIPEDKILKFIEKNEINYCTGKKNTIYFLDTSKCFHAGSEKSPKSRVILFFQFLSPFSNHFDWFWKRSGILNKPKWKNNLLTNKQKKILGINI